MAKRAVKRHRPQFLPVNESDLKPAHRWHRPLQAPGITQVDFEERVDFKRLHRYRLARTRQALAKSGLGAVLCFDQHNIRYISSTVIGEWARDKLIRYCLLTGTGDPWVWDFGSAARHHKLYCPWLREDHVRAGNPGMRGAIGPKVGLFEAAAKEIKDILVREGVAGMPLGTPMDANLCYGVNPIEQRERYYEAHDLIIEAWQAKEPFSFHGRFNQMRYVNTWPRPVQRHDEAFGAHGDPPASGPPPSVRR